MLDRFKRIATVTALVAGLLAVGLAPARGVTYTGKLQDRGDFELGLPWGVTTDTFGNVYVADAAKHQIFKFSSQLDPILRFGSFGSGPGELYSPTGIAFGNNQIYVADTLNHRINIYSTDGFYQGTFGEQGNGDDQLGYPTGMMYAFDKVWVTEGGANCRVHMFTPSGQNAGMFGSCGSGNGQFSSPGGIASAGSYVYVTDQQLSRVQRFNVFGTYELTFGSYGSGPGQMHSPDGIAVVEGDGTPGDRRVFVVDSGPNSRVTEFTADGAYVSDFGGNGNVHFTYPHGLTISQTGIIWVADTQGSDVYEFREQPPDLRVAPSDGAQRVIKTQGIWVDLSYNQIDHQCDALAKGKMSIPGHDPFTVSDDFKVSNKITDNKVDLTSKQTGWFKQAINRKKSPTVKWTVIAKCTNDVRLTETKAHKY